MFRLAHISDIHLGPLPDMTMRQLASKRITGYVNWQTRRGRNHKGDVSGHILKAIAEVKPSHVAVTGDLINLGHESEIEGARFWLQTIGEPEDVSVVPGNHDAYVPGSLARIHRAWKPWMQGDVPDETDTPFPYLRVRGSVALIGISSARATAPFLATGFFRKSQARALDELLTETRKRNLFRVIMIHHPPLRRASAYHKRLVGASLFRHVVRKQGAELILHGHTHLPTLGWIKRDEISVPVVGVAAAGQEHGGMRPAAQFNLFDIDGQTGNWQVTLTRRGLVPGTEDVRELSRTVLFGHEAEKTV